MLQLSGNRLIFAPFKHSRGRKKSPIQGGYYYATTLLGNKVNAAPREVVDNTLKELPREA